MPWPSAGPSCSSVVARQTRMKRTPLLEFSADPAVMAGGRVEEVLRRIRGERHRRGHRCGGGDRAVPTTDPRRR